MVVGVDTKAVHRLPPGVEDLRDDVIAEGVQRRLVWQSTRRFVEILVRNGCYSDTFPPRSGPRGKCKHVTVPNLGEQLPPKPDRSVGQVDRTQQRVVVGTGYLAAAV